MDFDKLTDKNVSQLDFAAQHLGSKQRPGTRSDGGMEVPAQPVPSQKEVHQWIDHIAQTDQRLRTQLVDARNMIDNFERDLARLESDMASLQALFDDERVARVRFETRCEELKDILRKAAEVMVNGHKS